MEDTTFDERYIDALAALGTIRSYPKNTILIQEGDRSDQLYVVLAGRLKVFLADADGKEIIVDMLGPRQYFGEMAFDGGQRSASVMTVDPCKLAVVQREDFRLFLTQNSDAALALIVTLIRRARHLTRAVGSLALLDVYGRVARLLLDNAIEESGRLVISDKMTQNEIAKRVGSSRAMVSRILGDLKQGGYVSIEAGKMVIENVLPTHW
jgi:CRP/FNR family transcriptional regulator, cyclic AMP receptor protein